MSAGVAAERVRHLFTEDKAGSPCVDQPARDGENATADAKINPGAFLYRMVQGAVQWYTQGSPEVPLCCKHMYGEVIIENDSVMRVINSRLECSEEAEDKVRFSEFKDIVRQELRDRGLRSVSFPQLKQKMLDAGFVVRKCKEQGSYRDLLSRREKYPAVIPPGAW